MADAIRPHESIGPVEWAERYRRLPERGNAEPGPFKFDRRPYLRGILDTLGRGANDVVLQAPVQCGKSEAARVWLGWAADLDPGPAMLVFPSKDAVRENVEERIIPMFNESTRLRALVSDRAWDTKASRIALRTCTIHTGYAGSPQALATRPIRRAVCDEINKYPRYTGREASPVDLARARTATYEHRGQRLLISTPTIPSEGITAEYDACADRRTFRVPCPSCGALNEWDWNRVVWPGKDATDDEKLREQRMELEVGLLEAVYECPACEHKATDADRHGMVQRGEWVSEGQDAGVKEAATSVGFRLHGLCVPATSFTAMALEYVKARLGGIDKLQHFYNSILGLPFWGEGGGSSELLEVRSKTVHRKIEEGRHRCGVAPEWTRVVVAGADPGQTGAHYVVRAFGDGYRSCLLEAGWAGSLDELRALVLGRSWQVQNRVPVQALYMLVDTGGGKGQQSKSRTDEVYRWAKQDPARIRPIKGLGGTGQALQPIVTRSHSYSPNGGPSSYEVTLSVLDVGYFKDITASRVESEDEGLWQVGCNVSPDYVLHMCSEVKRLVERRIKPTGEVQDVFRWVTRVAGAPNHLWDCEVYATAAAYMLELDRPEPVQSYEVDRSWAGVRDGSWI